MGFYLYCLRKPSVSIKAVKTIDKGGVYTLPYKELEAVVSEVDLEKFSSEEIQKKAQEDLNWIKEKAQIHEHVIEQAMNLPTQAGLGQKIIPVIPMKFGTIFKTKKDIKKILKKNYLEFKKTLEKLEGKQEWGLKIYLEEEVFAKKLEKSEAILKKEKEISSMPSGMDFFAKKQINKAIDGIKNIKLEKITKSIFKHLGKLAWEKNKGKNLAKEITGRAEPMVLNANFFIKEEKVQEFQKEADGLKTKYKNSGLIIQESGPWPPYNFV